MFDVESARARVFECSSKKDYILRHLRIMDCFSERYLRKQEMEVLAELVSLGGTVTSEVRQVVMGKFSFSSNNLSNYLRELTRMGWLTSGPGTTYKVSPKAIPDAKFQQYAVQLTCPR